MRSFTVIRCPSTRWRSRPCAPLRLYVVLLPGGGAVRALLYRYTLSFYQVEEPSVRSFVDMAAVEHAPRFLRFLRGVMLPAGRPIRRNQLLVLNCLGEKEVTTLY